MKTQLIKIDYYLPEKIVDNQQLSKEFPQWSTDKIEEKVGVRERHVVEEDETALDLAWKAAEKVLRDYDRDRIDFIILCTQSPDYYLPTSACILQNRLALKTDIGALDFNLGCSGFIYGLALAKGLIVGKIANTVLLITAETYTRHIHPRDRGNRTIFGDGAAATIIEKGEMEGIGKFVLGTDGSGYKNLIVPNGGMRHRYNIEAAEIDDGSGNIQTSNNLHMNGPEIFNFSIRVVPGLITEILRKNRLALQDVDYVICHQANKFMLGYLRKKMKIPEEKFYINLLHTGNTVSATIPIAIKDSLAADLIKSGDNVLIAGFGVGYSWGGTVVKI